MTTSSCVQVETRDAVALLRFYRPPVNALDEIALQQLERAVDQVEANPAVRVVIFASAISNVFSAGGDLKYWPRVYADRPDVISAAGQRAFGRLERMSKPTIAVIQGHVIGDGLSIVLACDLAVASPDSTFQLPEIGFGFIPAWGTIGRLVEAVGTAYAAELLLVGERISATRAQTIGLINRVATNDDAMAVAEALAARLGEQPPIAVRYAKAALRGRPMESPVGAAWEARCFAASWGSTERHTGLERLFKTPRDDK